MLLLDLGNSRIKWALAEDGQWPQQGTAGINEWPLLQRAFAALPAQHRILVSNVAGAEAAEQLRTVCAMWDCRPEFISARLEQCGVRNSYEMPGQLGSDRWAALIAAWHHEQAACLVVNCGTATTIDALSDEGEFLGGLILPGLEMMRCALAGGTGQLGAAEGIWREFPRNTADAISSGAIQATVGAIARQYERLGKSTARCLLGGGAAGIVRPHLALPSLRLDNMVLRGLQLIGQESG